MLLLPNAPHDDVAFWRAKLPHAIFTNTDKNIGTGEILIEAETVNILDGTDINYVEWLKSTALGYTTAHFGKWHLGTASSSTPTENDFDFSDGSTTNNDDNSTGGTTQDDPKHLFELVIKQ
jgi:arylsulfatase A-like enzyme